MWDQREKDRKAMTRRSNVQMMLAMLSNAGRMVSSQIQQSRAMEQQRAITPLAPLLEQHADEGQANSGAQPDRVFVAIPTCSDGPEYSCPFEAFKTLALRSMDENCVSTVPVDALR